MYRLKWKHYWPAIPAVRETRTFVRRTPSARRRAGYVLLLVLVLLMIAASLMVRFTNETMIANTSALHSVERLQEKWAKLSCERVVLPAADSVFERLNTSESEEPVWQVRQTTVLGSQRIELVLCDESAKCSLQNLMRRGPTGTTALPTIQRLIPPALASALRFPSGAMQMGASLGDVSAPSSDVGAPSVSALSDLAEIRRLGGERRLVEFYEKMTIWWDGPINLKRAHDEALLATCQTVLTRGRAQRLLSTLRESPTVDVEVLLQRVVKNEDEQRRLRPLLSDASFAFALWTESSPVDSVGNQGELNVCVRSLSDTGQLTVQRVQFH